jgi:hypothetical protein
LRPFVGDEMSMRLVDVILNNPPRDAEGYEAMFLDRCFDSKPRPLGPSGGECEALGLAVSSRSSLKQLRHVLGMAIFTSSRMCISALCSWLTGELATVW